MKLKMYLIGLGMGVIVTAVIMGIALSGRVREMSDEEVIARARQLGMVESRSLTEVTDNGAGAFPGTQSETSAAASQSTPVLAQADTGNPSSLVITGEEDDGASTGSAADGASTGAGAGASSSEGENAAQGSQGGEGAAADAGATSGTQARAGQGDTNASDRTQDGVTNGASTGSAAGNTTGAATGSIVVTIPDASSSEEICVLLETAGVIDNATAFNNYLVQNGRDRYISTGAKLIPRGSSYEDVSRIITGR